MRDERGFTLVELLASITAFTVLFAAIMAMTTVATHNQDRIAKRVNSNQRLRPVIVRIMDGLHSSCVAPRVIPIATGSTATSISFTTRAGSAVNPIPDLRQVTLSGTNLTETVYPVSGGTAPTWSFSPTPSSTRTLLTNVSAPGNVPFRYYRFQNSQLTEIAAPLDATEASLTAQVSVTLTAAPSTGTNVQDPNSPITISDRADLRLESANQVSSVDSPPCA